MRWWRKQSDGMKVAVIWTLCLGVTVTLILVYRWW